MDKDITNSTFMEFCTPLDTKTLMKEINSLGLDRYSKKLDTITFLRLFIFAQITQISSLRNISGELNEKFELQEVIGLKSISAAQLSRKLRSTKPEFLEGIFGQCAGKIMRTCGLKAATEQLGRINLIDSSTVTMCLSQYPWAKFMKSKSGVKLHLRLVFRNALAYPDKAVLTPAKPADRTQMDALVVQEPGALNVFDRGYVDYRKFDEYCDNNVRFVTRLRENVTVAEVYEERPVKSSSSVVCDSIIKLGSKFRSMEHPIRRIVIHDDNGREVIILTNDFELDALEIGDLYRKRWQIELFFKWIKQHLKVKTLYGKSAYAVYNQLWIALITFCLLVLLQLKTGYQVRLLTIYKKVQYHWARAYDEFLYYLGRPPSKKSRGRVQVNHMQNFDQTLQQYINEEASHLDWLEYDPIN